MNLAGVSEDFGPHSRSVVLYACQIFFLQKIFLDEFFSGARHGIFLRASEKFFGRISALDFGWRKQNFFSDALKDFSKNGKRFFWKTHRNFLRDGKKFFSRQKEIFFWKCIWNFFWDEKKFFETEEILFLKMHRNFFRDGMKIFFWKCIWNFFWDGKKFFLENESDFFKTVHWNFLSRKFISVWKSVNAVRKFFEGRNHFWGERKKTLSADYFFEPEQKGN